MEYFVFRCSGVRRPEKHIRRFLSILLAQKPAASADEHPLVDRGQVYFLFYLKNTLSFGVWVSAPVD